MPYNAPNSIKNTANSLGVTTYDEETKQKLNEVAASVKAGTPISDVLRSMKLWDPVERPSK